MIKYEGVEYKYLYNTKIKDEIIEIIRACKYADYSESKCTQENIGKVVNAVSSFISSITPLEQKVVLERHETEEEARQYFGTEFIEKFDRLLNILDQQQTRVALHGTFVERCPSICEKGLQYKNPNLTSTAALKQKPMPYGQDDIHYSDYEGLLNWRHHEHKGIVIVAVPYECFYKEGLWRKYKNTASDEYEYKIDPDFIVGYLDIKNKNIVLNPKYSREHNYDGYLPDNEIFHERKELDNDSFRNEAILAEQEPLNTASEPITEDNFKEQKIDGSEVGNVLEDILNVLVNCPNEMNQNQYKETIKTLSDNFNLIQKVLPQLKTNEQVRLEKESNTLAEQYQNGAVEANLEWEKIMLEWDSAGQVEATEEDKKTGKGL